ncbi:PaaI family thioesterase [Herbiconiux daphne]|uniref:PaaI family thioesterase n=1 Tax=Herbiconiux daphne TaxID=2970914 RepID=A0ABT2H401_9MICO|nr:PaaI family thioesterase [Herbiconiux daphne]MCS5734637.1 PaaI family thioesterase [Herbiconiux daphne]
MESDDASAPPPDAASPDADSPDAAPPDAARQPVRRRLVEWDDPFIGVKAAAGLTGLEFLQAMIDGELPPPPIGKLVDMTLVSAEPGTATFTCTPNESHYNPIGIVHGGLVCTLLDSAAGCAVQTTLPAGVGYTSIEIKVSYLRPLHHDSGELTCVGRVVKPGRRVAFAEASVTDAAGRVVATATSSLLVFPLAATG